MKVQKSKRIDEKLAFLMETRAASDTLYNQLSHMINANSVFPENIEDLRNMAIATRQEMINHNVKPYSVEQIMLIHFIQSMVDQILIYQSDDIFEFFMSQFELESKSFRLEDIQENPYIRDIDFTNKELNDYELRYESDRPYELQIYDVPKYIDELHVHIPRICWFSEEHVYPVIYQKSIKSVWMSVTPNEIFTMEKHINMAKGKVLTLGCGIGYFAYMASLKSE